MSNLLSLKGVKFFAIVVLAVAVLTTFGVVAVEQANAQQAAVSASDIQYAATVQQGSSGQASLIWQKFFNGYSSANLVADGAFGPLTSAAAKIWQASRGLVADGVLGPMSRASAVAQINAGINMPGPGTFPAGCSSSSGYSVTTGLPCSGGANLPAGCTSTAGYSPTTGTKCDSAGSTPSTSGPLSGGAGSITATKTNTFATEDVGEGEDEVGVLSFDVEADDSDVELTTVKVELHQGTAADSENLTDYVTSVQVFLGDEMVGEADMDEFSESNDVYTKSISLNGAVIREDDEEEVSVRVTAQNSVDSADRDTAVINIGVSSIRFVDGDDVNTTDAFTLDIDDDAVDEALEESFTITTFATSSDTELKITNGEDADDVNDAHVIDIHATDETVNIPLLSFNLEVEGDSDVVIDQLPVRFTRSAGNVDDMISGITLWMDGDEIASVAMSSDCVEAGAGCSGVGTQETFFFDDMDLTLDAGDDHEFLVKVDIYGITDTGDVAAGDTILAEFGEIQTDLSQFDAEDEAGDELADGDKTGTVAGSASEVRDVGINVELVGATAAKP